MHRDPYSHKGENGKVAVIGGSHDIHGAPLFSALAAEASGVDLLFVSVPRIHEHVARAQSLNFQVRHFTGDELTEADTPMLLELLATMDSAVIGPGIDRSLQSLKALKELIQSASCTLVLDASALQPWTLDVVAGKRAVVTPHLGELERMGISLESIGEHAKETGVVIHVKGNPDRIAFADGSVHEVGGGNPGLTVGGTGDALAGFIAGLIAQKMELEEGCMTATRIIKQAGEKLFDKKGYAYTTRDVIEKIPMLLR
jgi:NAD(P)H-hydrate epimerase